MNINHSFVTLETRSHWTVEYTKTFEDYVILKKKKKNLGKFFLKIKMKGLKVNLENS